MKKIQVGTLDAVFKKIQLDIGLVIDFFEVKGTNAHINLDPFALSLPEPGTMKATVTQESVQEFLEFQSPGGLKNFEVVAKEEKLYVSATAKMVVAVPVSAICHLEIENDKELVVKLDEVKVMGGGAKNLVESQLSKINPILDANDLPINCILTHVSVTDGKIKLDGKVVG